MGSGIPAVAGKYAAAVEVGLSLAVRAPRFLRIALGDFPVAHLPTGLLIG
jgi:hypothetical protein